VSNYPVPPCGTAHGGAAFQQKIVPNWKMLGGASLYPAIIRHSGLNNIAIASEYLVFHRFDPRTEENISIPPEAFFDKACMSALISHADRYNVAWIQDTSCQ
jgi:hypothetical protein